MQDEDVRDMLQESVLRIVLTEGPEKAFIPGVPNTSIAALVDLPPINPFIIKSALGCVLTCLNTDYNIHKGGQTNER
jgi:hypothetical protein